MNGFSRQYYRSATTESDSMKSSINKSDDSKLLLGSIAAPVKENEDVAEWRVRWARYLCDAYYNGVLDIGNLIFTLILLNMDIFDNYDNLAY